MQKIKDIGIGILHLPLLPLGTYDIIVAFIGVNHPRSLFNLT